MPSAAAAARAVQFLQNGKVLVVLQHEARRGAHGIRRQLPDAQSIQCRGPVQCLSNGGLFQDGFAGAQRYDDFGILGRSRFMVDTFDLYD